MASETGHEHKAAATHVWRQKSQGKGREALEALFNLFASVQKFTLQASHSVFVFRATSFQFSSENSKFGEIESSPSWLLGL